MFQAHDGPIFLPVSVYSGLSHLLGLTFCFVLFYFPFPFLSSSFSRRLRMHKSRQKEKRSECQLMAQFAAKYKESKLGPARLGKYASSSVGRELNKYTHFRIRVARYRTVLKTRTRCLSNLWLIIHKRDKIRVFMHYATIHR